MKKNVFILFIVFSFIVIGCSQIDDAIDDGTDTEEDDSADSNDYLPDGDMIEFILGKIGKENDLPDFEDRAVFSMPEELESWDADDEKAEIEEVINTVNVIAENPLRNLGALASRSLSVRREITGYEEIPGSSSPEYSTCTYRWIEDGQYRITWIDTHMMEANDSSTVFTWLIEIFYQNVNSDGTFSDIRLVLKDQCEDTHYPMTLIDTKWYTEHWIVDGVSGVNYPWTTYLFEHDDEGNIYITDSAVQEWDSSLGNHAIYRIHCEWPEAEELFEQPTYHWTMYLWDYSDKAEYLWIDYSIDMKTLQWSYIVKNEDGGIIASGES